MHDNTKTSDAHFTQHLSQDNLTTPTIKPSTDFKHISIMEFINGNIHQHQTKTYSKRAILLLEFCTLLFVGLYRWMHVHFLKKSQAYFSMLWLENLFVVFVLHFYLKRFSPSFSGTIPKITRQLKSLWSPILIYIFQTVVLGLDFFTFTRKAGGTEFYQLTMALSIPTLLALIYRFNFCQIPSYVYISLSVVSGWKIMMLLQDTEFQMSFSFSIWCLIFTIMSSFFTILLKGHLENNAVELFYYLSLSLVIILPFVIVSNDIVNTSVLSLYAIVKVVLVGLLLGFLKLASCLSTFILLKQSNPLVSTAVLNLTFFPDFLNQSLVYKWDCTLSALKVCLLYLVDFVIVQLNLMMVNTNPTVIDQERKFSLMT